MNLYVLWIWRMFPWLGVQVVWPRYCAVWWIIWSLILVWFQPKWVWRQQQQQLKLWCFFFFLNELVFGPITTWCLIQLWCQNTLSSCSHCHADIWEIMGSAEMRALQLWWLLTDIKNVQWVLYAHAQHAHAQSWRLKFLTLCGNLKTSKPLTACSLTRLE